MIEKKQTAPFIITINDGFCTWQFDFNPEGANDLCIQDIMDVINKHFESPEDSGKLIKEFEFKGIKQSNLRH